jgi:hypothetical protein
MNNISLKVLPSLTAIALAISCVGEKYGRERTSASGRVAEEIAPIDGSNIDGHYQAKFTTLNPHVNGTIPGSANFFRREEKLLAYVRLFAGGVRAWHQQFVYTGNRCPTLSDDANGDGFIDINEAEGVLGKILIPLDSDISGQNSGRKFFPIADLSGYYSYERITSFKRFLKDLQEVDNDPDDDMVKLSEGEGLRLIGKTVLILGVAETVELPESVKTKGKHEAYETLPIVCGVFDKVLTPPGTPYAQDEIPGPVSPYEEGQDRPATDEIPTSSGSTSSGTTGAGTGNNDSENGDGPISDGEGGTSRGPTTTGRSTGDPSSPESGETSGGSSETSSGGSTTGGTPGGGPTTGSEGSGRGPETTGPANGDAGGSAPNSSRPSSTSAVTSTSTTGGVSSLSATDPRGNGGFLNSRSGI